MVTNQILTNLKSIQHNILENPINMKPKKHSTTSKANQYYIMIILCNITYSYILYITMHNGYMNDAIQ